MASHLHCTVATLTARMSALELERWIAWLDAEQIGPGWDRLRHAQLLEAMHNSGRIGKKGGGLFKTLDFMPADPWAPPAPIAKPKTLAEYRAAARRAGMGA